MLKYRKKSSKNRKKFQKISTFVLPILPNRYILTQQSSFLVQNRLSFRKKNPPKFPIFQKFQISKIPDYYANLPFGVIQFVFSVLAFSRRLTSFICRSRAIYLYQPGRSLRIISIPWICLLLLQMLFWHITTTILPFDLWTRQ